MTPQGNIEHLGKIVEIRDGVIRVAITSESACRLCHAREFCMPGDQAEKIVEIKDAAGVYQAGETVRVLLKQTAGERAVLLGYVFPFGILMAALAFFWKLTRQEVTAGLLSLASLVPYYVILYVFRNKLTHAFRFSIEKI